MSSAAVSTDEPRNETSRETLAAMVLANEDIMAQNALQIERLDTGAFAFGDREASRHEEQFDEFFLTIGRAIE